MSDRPDPLEEILASIADGRPVDWEAARQGLPEDHQRMGALDGISRIASFNRSLQHGGTPFGGGGQDSVEIPLRWGDLLLMERLSSGTHAELFRAWDIRLRREVVLKLLCTDTAQRGGEALLEEGRRAARIRHANVVVVYGVDTHEGRTGFWMEYLRGTTLDREVSEAGPMRVEEVVRLGIEIGSALAAVHEAGLLHRDLKPSNILRDADGRYVLADFGLGQETERSYPGEATSGTPMYMAPELFEGTAPSERSDVYALGLTLWFALAGRHPFASRSLPGLLAEVERGPAPLRGIVKGVPAEVEAILRRATARRPEDRYAAAKQLVDALAARTAGSSGRGTWRRVAGVAVLLGVVLSVGFLVVGRGNRAHPGTDTSAGRELKDVPLVPYDVEATFHRTTGQGTLPLLDGDRVNPGDHLSLEIRVSHPAWVYVLDADDRGETYLLFPQSRFDLQNPVPGGSAHVLPGTIEGRENAWTVTSAGGREYLLVITSLQPVPEIESELAGIPPADPGRPIEYVAVDAGTVEALRGVGGVRALPETTAVGSGARIFDQFRSLAGRESGVRGIWMRQIVLENPGRP